MTSAIRKTMILAIGLVTVLGGSAVAVAVVNPYAALSTAHGEGFQIRSQLDPTFCIDVAAGATQGRPLSLSACLQGLQTQLWTFTNNSDGSNLLVDYMGMCVDTAGRKVGDGLALKVRKCSFVSSQRFQFTSVGRIQVTGTTKCLSIPRAAPAVAVFLETCNSSNPREVFKLAL